MPNAIFEVGIMLNPMDPFLVSKHATAFTKDPLNYMTNAVPKGLLIVGQVCFFLL